jgi:hypothetical protein
MSETRIYRVANGESVRLVRGTHQASVLRHVARQAYDVRVATQDDLERLLGAGVKVEVAKVDQEAAAA